MKKKNSRGSAGWDFRTSRYQDEPTSTRFVLDFRIPPGRGLGNIKSARGVLESAIPCDQLRGE